MVRFEIPANVLAKELHDEVVLLDTKSGAFHGLNEAAAIVWLVVAKGGAALEATDALLDHFDVDRSTAEQDVAALLQELVGSGLLVPIRP